MVVVLLSATHLVDIAPDGHVTAAVGAECHAALDGFVDTDEGKYAAVVPGQQAEVRHPHCEIWCDRAVAFPVYTMAGDAMGLILAQFALSSDRLML